IEAVFFPQDVYSAKNERLIMSIEKQGSETLSSAEKSSAGEAAATPDEKQHTAQEDVAQPSFFRLPFFQWKSFLIFLGVSIGIVGHWLSTSELFDIPPDIALSRESFFQAKEGYFANSTYWDAKQQHFVSYIQKELLENNEQLLLQRLQETPGEILISFL